MSKLRTGLLFPLVVAPRLLVLVLLLLTTELRAELLVFELRLKAHLFSPSTLYVPAGQKIKLVIYNEDPSPEEFESFALNREKVVLGHSKGVVFLGPITAGQYSFSGEYNPNSARGVLIALSPVDWAAYQAQAATTPALAVHQRSAEGAADAD